MNDETIFKIFAMLGPIVGVIIGGVITFFSTHFVEYRKWHREQQEKLNNLKRDALSKALEWIEPMRNAETSASSMILSAIKGNYDLSEYHKRFPNLLSKLTEMDLSGSQRAVIDQSFYMSGNRIIREFDELRYLGIKYGEEAKAMGKFNAGFYECATKVGDIKNQIDTLESDLRKAFKHTFGKK